MKRLMILSVIIASILYSKEDKIIVSINGLESAGLSKRYINYSQYTIQEISIDLEETVSKMIGDKYSINIHFTAYESVENTINVARDSLSIIIKTIKQLNICLANALIATVCAVAFTSAAIIENARAESTISNFALLLFEIVKFNIINL